MQPILEPSSASGPASHAAIVYRLQGIVELARRVRNAQKAYFASRTHEALHISKQLERKLDEALTHFDRPPQQSSLFPTAREAWQDGH